MEKAKPWKIEDGPISRYLNRRISWIVTQTIIRYKLSLTPNQMSLITFLIGILASPFYIFGFPMIGGILAQLSSILDGVDGELARIRNVRTKSGGYLDTVLDRFVDFSVIISLTYFTAQYYGNTSFIYLLGILALAGTFLCTYVHVAFKAYCSKEIASITKIPHIASRDIRLFVIFLGSVLGLYIETLALLILITYTHTILRFLDLFHRFRKLELQASRSY